MQFILCAKRCYGKSYRKQAGMCTLVVLLSVERDIFYNKGEVDL